MLKPEIIQTFDSILLLKINVALREKEGLNDFRILHLATNILLHL